MELEYYFKPVDTSLISNNHSDALSQMVCFISHENINQLAKSQVVIFGVQDARNGSSVGVAQSPDAIRRWLYTLYKPSKSDFIIADLGNLVNGQTVNDTYAALRGIIKYLNELQKKIIVLGSSQDCAYPVLQAYASKKTCTVTHIDSQLDIGSVEELSPRSFFRRAINDGICQRLINVGYQNYLNSESDVLFYEQRHFAALRLGFARDEIKNIEPYLRDADLCIFDFNAIRQPDAWAATHPSPNGFTALESCIIARYAGISDKSNCFYLCEIDTTKDQHSQSAHLAAQIVWHVIEGIAQTKGDFPAQAVTNYTHYMVPLDSIDLTLQFYQSPHTGRWWFAVPRADDSFEIIACNYADYQTACTNQVPDSWIREKSRLSF